MSSRADAPKAEETLAIFDIDGTLVSGRSSERRFFEFMRAKKRITASRWLLFFSFMFSQWIRFGVHVNKKNKAYLNDFAVSEVAQLAQEFVQKELLSCLVDATMQRLQWHQSQGHRVVLLSGTLQEVADALGDAIGVDDVIATRCSTRNDRFTSSAPWRHPYGRAKLSIATTFADAVGSRLESAYAYGDSHKDRFLMRAVEHPVSVSPDRGLMRLSIRKGWEILNVGRRRSL